MPDFSKAYEQFGRWVADEWRDPWGGDIGGDAIQDKLRELGILSTESFCRERHEGLVYDWEQFEDGDVVYFFVEGATPLAESQETP